MCRLPLVLVLVTLIVASGCNSGDSSTTASPAAPSASAVPTTLPDPATVSDDCVVAVTLHILFVLERQETPDQAARALIDVAGVNGAPYRTFVRSLTTAQAAAQNDGIKAGLPAAEPQIRRDCQTFTAEAVSRSRAPAPAPEPPTATAPNTESPPDLETSLPELSLGCERIIVEVAPALLRDPNAVLEEMAATYGRAGDDVIDAAFNFSDDPRLETDPAAVARQACG